MRTNNPVDVARKAIAAELVLDVRRCDRELVELRQRIEDAVDASGTTLLDVYGVGPIVAALILGYTVIRRGSRPLRRLQRHRPDRGVVGPEGPASVEPSREPEAEPRDAPHRRHPDPQRRHTGPGVLRRQARRGKTKKEALRALKRRVSDAVWRQLQVDLGLR